MTNAATHCLRSCRLFAAFLVLLLPRTSFARTWTIQPDGLGDAPTIQAGLDSAAAGDTVLVVCGTYYEHDLEMQSDVCLRGESGDWTCATIDAQRQGRVLACTDAGAATRIEGLTLTGGGTIEPEESVSGAGLRLLNSPVTVARCRITNNWGDYGGGIYAQGSPDPVVVEDCLIDHNTVQAGIDPWGGSGGGIYSYFGGLTLRRVTFRANQAGDSGGGLFAENVEAHDCVFYENLCSDAGAAIHCDQGVITRCTIVACNASRGMVASSWSVMMSGTIIASNDGRPVYCWGGQLVTCCDVYGNSGGDWVGCLGGLQGVSGNFSADPRFCDQAAGDFRLAESSPCLPEQHPDGFDCGLIGALPACEVSATAVPVPADPRAGETETGLFLGPIGPNPSPPGTEIFFVLPPDAERSALTLRVLEATGRQVRLLVDGTMSAGRHQVRWDGTSDAGVAAVSGLYFVWLEWGAQRRTARLILAR